MTFCCCFRNFSFFFYKISCRNFEKSVLFKFEDFCLVGFEKKRFFFLCWYQKGGIKFLFRVLILIQIFFFIGFYSSTDFFFSFLKQLLMYRLFEICRPSPVELLSKIIEEREERQREIVYTSLKGTAQNSFNGLLLRFSFFSFVIIAIFSCHFKCPKKNSHQRCCQSWKLPEASRFIHQRQIYWQKKSYCLIREQTRIFP